MPPRANGERRTCYPLAWQIRLFIPCRVDMPLLHAGVPPPGLAWPAPLRRHELAIQFPSWPTWPCPAPPLSIKVRFDFSRPGPLFSWRAGTQLAGRGWSRLVAAHPGGG